MQNTMVQKSEFSKMRDCSGFLQIGSHICTLECGVVKARSLYLSVYVHHLANHASALVCT